MGTGAILRGSFKISSVQPVNGGGGEGAVSTSAASVHAVGGG